MSTVVTRVLTGDREVAGGGEGRNGIVFSVANFLDEYTVFYLFIFHFFSPGHGCVQAREKSYKVIIWSSEPHQTKDIKKILITNSGYLLLLLRFCVCFEHPPLPPVCTRKNYLWT